MPKSSILAVIGLAAAATAAQAASVDLRFVGVGQGQTVRITIGASTFNTFAGQLKHQFTNGTGPMARFNGQTLVTFCTDLTEHTTSTAKTYSVVDVKDVPVTAGWPAMGQDRADAMERLFAAAPSSLFDWTAADPAHAAAFQIAVWEIAYDYNEANPLSFDVTAGNFRARQTSGAALAAPVSTWLSNLAVSVNDLDGGASRVLGLSRSGSQDQLQVVPLPSTGVLGLAGLGLVGTARRRAR